MLEGVQAYGDQKVEPVSWLSGVGVQILPRVHDRVLAEGLATRVPGGRSWMYFVRKPDHLELTATGEDARQGLRAVLLGNEAPDARTAVLAGLAWACDLVELMSPAKNAPRPRSASQHLRTRAQCRKP